MDSPSLRWADEEMSESDYDVIPETDEEACFLQEEASAAAAHLATARNTTPHISTQPPTPSTPTTNPQILDLPQSG